MEPKTRESTTPIPLIEECKVRASLLCKDLRGADPQRAAAALRRMSRLEPPGPGPSAFQHKHALAVVAGEIGYPSWTELTDDSSARPEITKVAVDTWASRLCPRSAGGFLNHWFVAYAEAQELRARQGGYLLPYRAQFFVCQAGFIAALGLLPEHSDWQAIDWDWVRPRDLPAWRRLNVLVH